MQSLPLLTVVPSSRKSLCLIAAGLSTLLLVSCSSTTDNQEANNNVANAAAASDMAIANALYFNERTPEGFYHENFEDDAFYSVSHVKNVDLLPYSARTGLAVHELASDDFIEAMGWVEQAAGFLQANDQLVDNSETSLYYQFTRVDPASPQFTHMYRVFKANVLDRNGVDRGDEDGEYKGRITSAEITAEKVKLILEYLWLFTISNNYYNTVLDSYTAETADSFIHIMNQASLTTNNNDNCDTIQVYEIRYTIPKVSGFVWKDKSLTHRFSTRRVGDRIETCG